MSFDYFRTTSTQPIPVELQLFNPELTANWIHSHTCRNSNYYYSYYYYNCIYSTSVDRNSNHSAQSDSHNVV